VLFLDAEVADLDARRTALVAEVAPGLLNAFGVGPHTAATLLVTVGDNLERLRDEATFVRLCGVAPIPTGSGKTDGYHRLHRGGDRQANSALWTIDAQPDNRRPRLTSSDAPMKATRPGSSCAASSVTSRARSSSSCHARTCC
jgi:transposase